MRVQKILRSKDVKVLVGLFFVAIISCAGQNKANAEDPNNLKPNTNQASSVVNQNRSNVAATNPNSGGANYNQRINYNVKPRNNSAVSGSSRSVNVNPFSINDFFNRIISSGKTGYTQAAVNTQKNSIQYSPGKNTSFMSYFMTKISRSQK
jgi:hypothetical protein